MDSHEKLGNLLSAYLSSEKDASQVPENVIDAFHLLGLSEFASSQNVEETYREKVNQLEMDMKTSSNSRFSRAYQAQQKKEFDDAYSLISSWFSSKA